MKLQMRVRKRTGKWEVQDVPEGVWYAMQSVESWMRSQDVVQLGVLRRYPERDPVPVRSER